MRGNLALVLYDLGTPVLLLFTLTVNAFENKLLLLGLRSIVNKVNRIGEGVFSSVRLQMRFELLDILLDELHGLVTVSKHAELMSSLLLNDMGDFAAKLVQ